LLVVVFPPHPAQKIPHDVAIHPRMTEATVYAV
jgi:hypothetical protein